MEEVLGAGLAVAGIVLATAQLSLVRGKMAHLEREADAAEPDSDKPRGTSETTS